jgi:hypothetical protein
VEKSFRGNSGNKASGITTDKLPREIQPREIQLREEQPDKSLVEIQLGKYNLENNKLII